jgi:NodT family efflux transporter outer membrane factor (OMF) lipoprotein
MKPFPLVLLAATALSGTLGGCALGPNYHRPTAPVEQHFTASEGWTPATPADQIQKGAWWQVYNDPALNDLETKVVINNQNVAAAEAVVRQSEATITEQQAALWPTLGLTFGANRTGGGTNGGTSGGGTTTSNGNRFSAGVDAGWTLDIWGKVRREIEQAKDQAQSSKADLANATLTAQATLAITYFELRATEEQQKLLQTTVDNYQKALTLTQNQYNSGVAQRSDVLQAQSQLATTKAQLQDLSLTRGQYEHAIAVLIGTTPDQVNIPAGDLATVVPVVPTGVPSQLLQRRPDIAASERLAAAANANIGVAETAFFPTLSLSATDTASSSTLSKLFAAHNSTWSIGADVAEDLVYLPALSAAVKGARAGYSEAVAKYRETVLEAFQGTEDNLLALRVLEGEQGLRQEAEQEARQAEQIELNDYKAGTVAYTSVITAQNTTLNAMISTLTVRQARLVASVTLIEDLGGGWDDTQLKGK